MRRLLLLAAGLAVLATPALAAQGDLTRASKGYTYFNRDGADMAAHDAAVKSCVLQAGRAAQTDPHSMGAMGNSLGEYIDKAIIQGLTGAIARGVNSDADAANVENCMVVRGWSVIQVDAGEGADLVKRPRDEQHATLAGWMGGAPHGALVRRFENDLARLATRIDGRPGGGGPLSLSITAVGEMPDPGRARVWHPDYFRLVQAGIITETVAQADFGTLGPDETLIVFRVIDGPRSDFTGLHFNLDDPKMSFTGSRIAIHRPSKSMWNKSDEAIYVFRVPTGRWRMERLRSMLTLQSSVSLCLGAPAFDIAAGEAIWGGTIAMGGEGRFVPAMDMTPIRQSLAAWPDLLARLKPARWMNGVATDCGKDSYIYGLQIPGAPTAP